MKLTLDFALKKIIIEDEISLSELYEQIQKVLPDWKEWKLESKVVYRDSQYFPYVQLPYIQPFQPLPVAPNPLYPTWCGGGTGTQC